MTFSELLAAVRQPYLATFAQVATQVASHVEPAFRRSDGSLALDGLLALPCRADVIPKAGSTAGQTIRVDSETRLAFEPFTFALADSEVAVSPFVWDWMPLAVLGLNQQAAADVFQSWFLDWFDTDDTNVLTDDGLFGVVHFMSDPEAIEEGWRVSIDLGSAPACAVDDILFRMSDVGAARILIG